MIRFSRRASAGPVSSVPAGRALRWRARHPSPPAPWLREVTEFATVFVTVGAVHVLSAAVLHQPAGPLLLIGTGAAIVGTAGAVRLRAHRRGRRATGAARRTGDRLVVPRGTDAPALWRIRTTVRDTPGSLAALCTSLSRADVNILAIDLSPLGETVADELVVAAPDDLTAFDLVTAVNSGHGTEVWVSRADARDLTDLPTRVLDLAADVAADPAALPGILHEMFRDCEISWQPAESGPTGTEAAVAGAVAAGPVGEGLGGTTMRIRDPRGGLLVLSRAQRPFSPAEFARARALGTIAGISVPAR